MVHCSMTGHEEDLTRLNKCRTNHETKHMDVVVRCLLASEIERKIKKSKNVTKRKKS